MGRLSVLRSKTGKRYVVYTTAKEASESANHQGTAYDWKPITVYGVFLKSKK